MSHTLPPPTIDDLKDIIQLAFNAGAFHCPLEGQRAKPDHHAEYCVACRVRAWLTPERYLKPERTDG